MAESAEQVTDAGGYAPRVLRRADALLRQGAGPARQPALRAPDRRRPGERGSSRRSSAGPSQWSRTASTTSRARDVSGVAALRFLDLARGKCREVARLDVPVTPGAGLSVSPGRKTILFTAFKPNMADLFLIENFR